MTTPPLTPHAIEQFYRGPNLPTPCTVQVINIKPVSAPANSAPQEDRYRVVLSDGTHYASALFTSYLSEAVRSEQIRKHSVLRIDNAMCNVVQDRRVPVIIAAHVLQLDAGAKIGDPQPHPLANASAKANPPQTTTNTTTAAAPTSYNQPPPSTATTTTTATIGHQYNPSSNATTAYGGAPSTSTTGGYTGPAAPYAGQSASHAPAATAAPSSAPGMANGRPLININAFSPYSNSWAIKARVTQKGDMKQWSNARGQGCLFSFTVADATGDIRITAFKEDAERLINVICEGDVYVISGGKIKPANTQFNKTSSMYELTADHTTTCERVQDADAAAVPALTLEPVPIAQLAQCEPNSTVDVLGVVTDLGSVVTFVSKNTQREMTKRDVTLADQSGFQVRCTLWNRQAESPGFAEGQAVALRQAKISDFSGRSLSMLSSSGLVVNPDIPKTHELLGWYEQGGGRDTAFQSFQGGAGAGGMPGSSQLLGGGGSDDIKALADVLEANLGNGIKPDYYTCEVTVLQIGNKTMMYPACPTCNKKVIETGQGWKCEKCHVDHDQPQYRYIMSVLCGDATGCVWMQAFNEAGQVILGLDANALHQAQISDQLQFETHLAAAAGKPYRMRVRVKVEMFNEEPKPRHAIVELTPLAAAPQAMIAAGKHALEIIRGYE